MLQSTARLPEREAGARSCSRMARRLPAGVSALSEVHSVDHAAELAASTGVGGFWITWQTLRSFPSGT
jgi:hypothetical protein